MTYAVSFIEPLVQDNDNDALDTPSGTTTTQENTNSFWCALPSNLSAQSVTVVQLGGWSRDYSASGEGGHSVILTDHDQATLNTNTDIATTAFTMNSQVDAKRYNIASHADLITHANTTKKQCWFTHRKTVANSARMNIMNPCVFIIRAA